MLKRESKTILSRTRVWRGHECPFRIVKDSAPFDLRLEIDAEHRGHWIVMSYRTSPAARPLRPMIRFQRAGGLIQVFTMPGVALDRAHWLGLLPRDLEAIHIAAEPGFVLERIGLRTHASLFAECLTKRPLRVVPALFNRLRGNQRRFRSILRNACAVTPRKHYDAWRAERRDSPSESSASSAAMIRLVLTAGPDSGDAQITIESLLNQTHRNWQLAIADPGASLRRDPRIGVMHWDDTLPFATLLGGADALGLLQVGDRLEPQALAWLAQALESTDAPDLAYGDCDSLGLGPRLKPDWSPDLALACDYWAGPSLFSARLIAKFGASPVGSADGLDLRLAAATTALRVAHVPRILCRSVPRAVPAAKTYARRLNGQLRVKGIPADAEAKDGVVDLAWRLPDPPPLASIVIPTRNQFELITRVTGDVLEGTDYPCRELVIVDNGSTDPEVLSLYERLRTDPRVRIITFPQPFNFAAMVNAGVSTARGRVVVLLNNDVAVLHPDWLGHLVAQACRPEVGAVGAKLLYGDGRLQHAGVVVGLGGRAGHVLRRRPADSPGHLGALRVAHEVSAVTAACLAVERMKYQAIGGFDAANFAIDFNDVDFCLRLGAAGYKTIWTPKAVLSHLESTTRGAPVGAERARFEREAEAFEARWRDVIRHDPFYHPALSLSTFGEDLE